MIKLDLTIDELKEIIYAVEAGGLSADVAIQNILIFQSKNRVSGKEKP